MFQSTYLLSSQKHPSWTNYTLKRSKEGEEKATKKKSKAL